MNPIASYADGVLRDLVPQLDSQANKYTRGKLAVVAGCARYPGAACLAAYAAQRSGAGYVQVFCSPQAVSVVQGYRPSLVVSSWEALGSSDLPMSKPGKPTACVIGPGFDGEDTACQELALKALRLAQSPALVDGGALSALATGEGRLIARDRAQAGLPTVLTPHGGEAARLAKAARIQAESEPELAASLAMAYGANVVLKGPNTFVSDGERVVAVTCGTPALAKAGTGDVLAGMVGALMAQGVDAFDAAVLGAELHARAGLACESRMPALCVTPEDLIEAIPAAISSL